MSTPAPQIFAADGSALGLLSFGAVVSGTVSAVVGFSVWNRQGDTSAGLLTDVRVEVWELKPGDAAPNQDGDASLAGYVELQASGVLAGASGNAPQAQVTAWQRNGRGRPLRLDPVPADSGRVVQARLNLPLGQLDQSWQFQIVIRWGEPCAGISEGAWEAGCRGVLSGAGDGLATFLIAGGDCAPSGSPDLNVQISDAVWRFAGAPVARVQGPLAFTSVDGAGTALAAGQAYWAAVLLDAAGALAVVKGLAAAAPAPNSTRPAVDQRQLLAFVQVPQAGGITGADIDQDGRLFGGWGLYGAVGLSARLGPGAGVVSSTLIESDFYEALTFPASQADYRVWKVPSNPPTVLAAGPTPPDPRALELWRLVTGVAAITSMLDIRAWARPDPEEVRLRFAGALAPGQAVYATLARPEPRALALPVPIVASCDPVAAGSGSNVFEVEFWNGSAWVTLFTNSGTQDRRPALAGAGPFVSTAALPEVLVLPGWTQVRARVVSVSAPAPTGAEIVLNFERA